MRQRARTFSLSARFLPARVRQDVQVLYAYFRTLDDLADESPGTLGIQQIEAIEQGLMVGGGGDPLLERVTSIATRYEIPMNLLLEIIEGVRVDLSHTAFDNYEGLYSYANLVAGSVGATLSYVLGQPSGQSLASARQLGIAMQLTNILRDIREDLNRGRLYLPLSDLQRFGLEIDDVRRHVLDQRFAQLMSCQIRRARELYESGLAGLKYLHPANRFAVAAAAVLYCDILTKIEDADFDVFSSRIALCRHEKLLRLPHAYKVGRRLGSERPQGAAEAA